MHLNTYRLTAAREIEPEGCEPRVIKLISASSRIMCRMNYLVYTVRACERSQPVGDTFALAASALSEECEGLGEHGRWNFYHRLPPLTALGRRAKTVPVVMCASMSETFSGVTSLPSVRYSAMRWR